MLVVCQDPITYVSSRCGTQEHKVGRESVVAKSKLGQSLLYKEILWEFVWLNLQDLGYATKQKLQAACWQSLSETERVSAQKVSSHRSYRHVRRCQTHLAQFCRARPGWSYVCDSWCEGRPTVMVVSRGMWMEREDGVGIEVWLPDVAGSDDSFDG
jgi:hypothetical protein